MSPRLILINLSFALICFFGVLHGVDAQTALSGDKVCGSGTTPCTFSDLGHVLKSALAFLLQLAIMFVVVMIVYSGIKLMTAQNKATELAEAKTRLWNVVLGVILLSLIASVSTYIVMLKFLGVQDSVLQFLSSLFAYLPQLLPIEHAYAADTLPNPLGVSSLYEFLKTIIVLVIRWFVFPVIIFTWLYTGFLFVAAQGSPEKLKDARGWLWWSVIGTAIIVLAEGFALSLQGTINQIF